MLLMILDLEVAHYLTKLKPEFKCLACFNTLTRPSQLIKKSQDCDLWKSVNAHMSVYSFCIYLQCVLLQLSIVTNHRPVC